MSMNSLPPELHAQIFSFACVDFGVGSNVSLVSRYYNELASPYLYRALSLKSTHLPCLLETLQNKPPSKRQVQHLFLEDTDVPFEPKDVLALLSLTSPTLHTLAIISNHPQTGVPILGRLFRTRFPVLKELWVSGYYPLPSTPVFPSLKRLHLNGNRNPHGLLQTGNLEESCPSLTHLDISGLNMAVTFTLELESALQGKGVETLFPATLPSRLESIVVRPGPEMVFGGKTAKLKDELMELHLVRIASAVDTSAVRVERRERGVVGVEDARGEWLGVVREAICGMYCGCCWTRQ